MLVKQTSLHLIIVVLGSLLVAPSLVLATQCVDPGSTGGCFSTIQSSVDNGGGANGNGGNGNGDLNVWQACAHMLETCGDDLVQVEIEFAACDANLVQVEADLAACEALSTIFPGDGVDGPALNYTDTGLTVQDNNTGLEWEKKVAGGGGPGTCLTDLHGVDSRCTWAQATGAWIDALNMENYAGHSDWRLPNVRELMSVVDYGVGSGPIIDSIFGPTATGIYWSSTANAPSPVLAWVVTFGTGGVGFLNKLDSHHVRAVRGGR